MERLQTGREHYSYRTLPSHVLGDLANLRFRDCVFRDIQVREMVTGTTNDGVTSLMVAVTKDMEVFHALMDLFDATLSSQQVQ